MSRALQPAAVAAQRLTMGSGSISLFRAGEGRPTLFLHAAGGAGEWAPFHQLLSERVDVIAPDHPGFGASDDLAELTTVDDLVYHYLDLLDLLELDQVIWSGRPSGGGSRQSSPCIRPSASVDSCCWDLSVCAFRERRSPTCSS